ncbi:carboxyl-terminal processing protease CtpA [Crocosphaera chwakensis]|uniref:Carboxyl-terminal-processing protease n=1 Tax=Crocosphaera chwakensis CCY0110 TaxID=391612 RepID=A3IMQ5_9CHRO|nr:carboxyl-terminal processing protease CtpA [Crocosphaera chwakensis]EAZ92158.1 carboxyl-terminal processing protease [Crocosphaera chwakensis CCY0110]
MRKRAFWVTLLVIFSLLFNFFAWTPNASAFTENQKLLLQSWRLVNQSYLDDTFNHQNWWLLRQDLLKRPLDDRQETYDTIEEMLASLDEPFTRLLRPEQYHNLQVSTAGELSGVGLQININPETGNLEVVAPIEGSPAEAIGINARDRILKIDDVDTTTLTLDEAATKMRGPRGTTVSLTILPYQKESDVRDIKIVRDRISLSPVTASLNQPIPNLPIGYIRLNQFSANAAQEMAEAINNLEKEGAQGYILDLRNNPGGLLQAGIQVARLWMDQGTIVYTVNRQGVQDSFTASGTALTDDPLVLLVNQGTASASEILAGALKDNGRATLVGEKTFGKGLIQSLFELPDGAGLAITVAKYETPSHSDIHKLGIQPDKVVAQDPISYQQIGTKDDLQYEAAIELLTGNSVLANAG